jgi:hypothetical protein
VKLIYHHLRIQGLKEWMMTYGKFQMIKINEMVMGWWKKRWWIKHLNMKIILFSFSDISLFIYGYKRSLYKQKYPHLILIKVNSSYYDIQSYFSSSLFSPFSFGLNLNLKIEKEQVVSVLVAVHV